MVDMPRQLRVEHPGAVCRVMSRRDRKKGICLDDVDWPANEAIRQD